MPRMSRLVMPGLAHHVTQRGVRSLPIFHDDEDRLLYVSLMSGQAERFGLRFLAWCLMPNHVHLIAVPRRAESLARGIGEAHRLYTRARNFSEGVRGYLFQGRFGSCVLDDRHLLMAARYGDKPGQSPIIGSTRTHQVRQFMAEPDRVAPRLKPPRRGP